jgi:hypothetical protein
MKILQPQVSEIHKSAFFYHGVIAESNGYKLETHQDGEITYDGGDTMKTYVGAETPKLATETDICDSDIENEDIVDIYVDKFFAITKDGEVMDDGSLCFDNYDEAILEFKDFLERV